MPEVTDLVSRIVELDRKLDKANAARGEFERLLDKAQTRLEMLLGSKTDSIFDAIDGVAIERTVMIHEKQLVEAQNARLREALTDAEACLDKAQQQIEAITGSKADSVFDAIDGVNLLLDRERAQNARMREVLVDAQKWASRWAPLTEHRNPNENSYGPYAQHPHGYAICPIPDWEVKQKRDDYADVLAESSAVSLEAFLKPYREACAFAYQLAGVADESVEALDNLSALANHEPAPHPWESLYPAGRGLEAIRAEAGRERSVKELREMATRLQHAGVEIFADVRLRERADEIERES